MELDLDAPGVLYRGWEIRSRLTHLSIEGTVAASAEVYLRGDCKCHFVSCRQFVLGDQALAAIEDKATRWIDQRQPTM
ncbi:MAG: hypothetical protein KKC85_12415 [Gammaproteobacteria bacterium]|nr:hypothetical protein [Gammaproteobacteria bacterium]MBU1440726.1 hypothetical protein [Gammaproteobacteria bacterium]MBU2287230.1 hypothetical protein [Gammaproteobacteria bacterium]